MKRIEKKHSIFFLGFILLWAFTWPPILGAEVPGQINFQGYLTKSDGNPLNGNYSIRFSIYNVYTGGSARWVETQVVTVIDGIYSVQLGLVTSFPVDLFNGNLYLGVKVDSDLEMMPRLPIASVAFAMKAQNADTLDGLDSAAFLRSGGGLADIDHSNLLVQGLGSFDTHGEEGILYLGDTDSYIKAIRGSGVRMGTFLAKDALNIQNQTGNVGIGTTAPEGLLHVSAGTAGDAQIILEADTDNNDEGDHPYIEFRQDGGSVRSLVGYDSSLGENDLKFQVASSGGDVGMRFYTGNLSSMIERMRITSAGTVQVGSDSKYLSMYSTGALVDLASTGSGLAINWAGSPTVMNVNGGKVGIGTSDPLYGKLHVYTSDNYNAIYGINFGEGSGLWAVTHSNDPEQAGVVADNQGAGPGIIATAGSNGYAGKFMGTVSVKVLEITGADLSEQYTVRGKDSSLLPTPGKVVSIDPENPGDLMVSSTAYDRKVAGIISGACDISIGMLMGKEGQGPDGKNPVALTGRVYCLSDASSGPIAPGDLLTTSNTPGHAMKVTDYERAQGAILGKAMSALAEGKGMVLVLVSLQ